MSALPPMPHLIVALATSPSQGCQQAMKNLALPQLDRLLARLSPAGLDAGNETDFSPPHERALARHLVKGAQLAQADIVRKNRHN